MDHTVVLPKTKQFNTNKLPRKYWLSRYGYKLYFTN